MINSNKTHPITLWEKFNESKQAYQHNHFEKGHTPADAPTPKSDQQKASWKNAKWRKTFAYLSGDGLVLTQEYLKGYVDVLKYSIKTTTTLGNKIALEEQLEHIEKTLGK